MRQKIIDEFTDLPVSRQRKRQLRLRRDGLCIICGCKPITSIHCEKHAVAHRKQAKASQRRRRPFIVVNGGSTTLRFIK